MLITYSGLNCSVHWIVFYSKESNSSRNFRDVSVFMGFKELRAGVKRNSVRDAVSRFF
jgi:hypothetical protein